MLPEPKTTSAAVYVYTGVLDMRVGFDRLAARIQEEYHRSAMQGGWYVFFSRTRDRVRIFYWDRDGYAMWTKRLEAGSYKVEKRDGYEEQTAIDLAHRFVHPTFLRIQSEELSCSVAFIGRTH